MASVRRASEVPGVSTAKVDCNESAPESKDISEGLGIRLFWNCVWATAEAPKRTAAIAAVKVFNTANVFTSVRMCANNLRLEEQIEN